MQKHNSKRVLPNRQSHPCYSPQTTVAMHFSEGGQTSLTRQFTLMWPCLSYRKPNLLFAIRQISRTVYLCSIVLLFLPPDLWLSLRPLQSFLCPHPPSPPVPYPKLPLIKECPSGWGGGLTESTQIYWTNTFNVFSYTRRLVLLQTANVHRGRFGGF